MIISSLAFSHNAAIPATYTSEGKDINPPLEFSEIPSGTQSLALIMDDPDAPIGRWVHWILFNLDPKINEIEENSVPEALRGINSARKLNYHEPCPPSGTHRYFFKLYALDTKLDLKEGLDVAELEQTMKDHILAQAELIGLYSKN